MTAPHARLRSSAVKQSLTQLEHPATYFHFEVARPERVELPTFWFVAKRSIQLSYGRADTTRGVQIDYDTRPVTSTAYMRVSACLALCLCRLLFTFAVCPLPLSLNLSVEEARAAIDRIVHAIVTPA